MSEYEEERLQPYREQIDNLTRELQEARDRIVILDRQVDRLEDELGEGIA